MYISASCGFFGDVNMAANIGDRYLDLIQKSVQNAIHGESQVEAAIAALLQRIRHPYLTRRGGWSWPSRAQTMIGEKRLANLRELVDRTLSENIPGDYIETGVWRGGACILIRAILETRGVTDRKVFLADSFEGLPRPNPERYPADKRDRLFKFHELAVSEEQVRENFRKYDLLDDQVIFLKGPFSETLSKLTTEQFALIRLDGDMYGSTMDALTNLYDRVSSGGFVIVDDYGALQNCRRAVNDFLSSRSLRPPIAPVDVSCVWWRKD
jgi:Macrocin-O-methyltransferase (TylF)